MTPCFALTWLRFIQVQANDTAPVDSLPPFSQVDLGETPLNESAAEARLRLFDELPACA